MVIYGHPGEKGVRSSPNIAWTGWHSPYCPTACCFCNCRGSLWLVYTVAVKYIKCRGSFCSQDECCVCVITIIIEVCVYVVSYFCGARVLVAICCSQELINQWH